MAPHPEADGEDRLQVVVLDLSRNRAISFRSNYPELPDSSLALELPFLEDVHEDWANKDDVQREMRRLIKRQLRAASYSADKVDSVAESIVDLLKRRRRS